jgi:hypothetical protein
MICLKSMTLNYREEDNMGTRSLTILNDVDEEVVVIYRQFDGYVEGHGKELAEILAPEGKPIPVVNGIRGGMCFNGGGCAAAHVVSKLKTEPGGIYLHKAGTRNCGEDYTYTVTFEAGKEPLVNVEYFSKTLFTGGVLSFYDFCHNPPKEEEEED